MMFSRSYLAVLLLVLPAIGAQLTAQTVSDVVTFNNTNFLANPGMAPAQGRKGKLYGTIYGGANSGSVFEFSTTGVTKLIYALSSALGYNPTVGLTLGTDGNFYGVTSAGGSAGWGVLFKVTPNGTYTVLHNFTGGTDSGIPESSPIEATDGNIYGTTNGGCCHSSTVYKYTPSGVFSTIYTFDHTHGMWANSLMQGSDGNLYSTAFEGGINNNGTIITLTTAGKLLLYYAFPGGAGGSVPGGPLVQAPDGNYYGITELGGLIQQGGLGTVFRLTPSGKVTVLYVFCSASNCTDGAYPGGGLALATDGNLYGTTTVGGANNFGTVFRLSTDGTFTSLYSFASAIGETPTGSLMQDTNGLLYGSAFNGGAFGFGAIYSVNLGLPPFISLVRPQGRAGHSVEILGQGLTGTTSLTFGGVPATSFSVVNDTYMTAVIPSGAKTGPVVATTPTGPLTSSMRFRIIK